MNKSFRFSGRYIWRDGNEVPRVGLYHGALKRIDLDLDADLASKLAVSMAAARRFADFICLPVARGTHGEASLSLAASTAGLVVVYMVDASTAASQRATLAMHARAGVDGMIAYVAGPELVSLQDASDVEARWLDFARELGWASAILGRGSLAQRGALLRGLARASDACGVVLSADDVDGPTRLADTSLVARLLSMRVEDRPAMVVVEGTSKLEARDALARVASLGLTCGYGVVVAAEAHQEALHEQCARLLASAASALGDPRVEDLAIYVADVREGDRVHEDAIHAALVLLRRATGQDARFCFHDRPDLVAPRFLWVPAHGELSEAAWMRLSALARAGSHIVLAGCRLSAKQVSRLEACPRAPSPAAERCQRRSLGRGSITLLGDFAVHDDQSRAAHSALVRALAELAAIDCQAHDYKAHVAGVAPARRLSFAQGQLEAWSAPWRLTWKRLGET